MRQRFLKNRERKKGREVVSKGGREGRKEGKGRDGQVKEGRYRGRKNAEPPKATGRTQRR